MKMIIGPTRGSAVSSVVQKDKSSDCIRQKKCVCARMEEDHVS